MHPNKTKAKLKAGGTVNGTYMRYGDNALAEVLCHLGYDYLLFDGEHAPIGDKEREDLARVCELTGVTSISRVPANQTWMISRCLDTGIQGVQIPMVTSAAEAEAAVKAAKYAPRGIRGLAAARAANFGQKLPFAYPEHVAYCNQETMVIVQVETVESLQAVPEIVKVPDIDVIFVGPTDLSLSMGYPGQVRHPEVVDAIKRVADIVAPSDKAFGILAVTAEATLEWQARGARYILSLFDTLLAGAVRDYLKTVRGE